jgi:hypothetical protein
MVFTLNSGHKLDVVKLNHTNSLPILRHHHEAVDGGVLMGWAAFHEVNFYNLKAESRLI